MSTTELIRRIEAEQQSLRTELYNAEGLLRLQETMAAYDGEYKLAWSEDIAERMKNRPKEEIYQTGVPLLDSLIDGFKGQQLITIGGDTGHGKTAFGLFMLEQFERLNPLMIPLEQSAEELIEQREFKGHSVPKFLSPEKIATRVSVDWIEERVVEGIAKHNTKLVLIDHLGYINDMDGEFKRENAAYRIGQVMKGLKNVAKKWNVIILLLVHISQHDEGKPPNREDIKNSSDIAQESDTILLIWKKNTQKKKVRVYENKALISVQKNRRTGKNGSIGLSFDTETGRYYEDNSWVQNMTESAEREVQEDELFV